MKVYKQTVSAFVDTSAPAPAPGTFWTSGTQGCSGSYIWCAARKMFYNSKWAPSQPAISAQAQCVTVKLDAQTAQLEAKDCAGVMNFICEVRCFDCGFWGRNVPTGNRFQERNNRWQSSSVRVCRKLQHLHGYSILD
jgi:hypothetical protein